MRAQPDVPAAPNETYADWTRLRHCFPLPAWVSGPARLRRRWRNGTFGSVHGRLSASWKARSTRHWIVALARQKRNPTPFMPTRYPVRIF